MRAPTSIVDLQAFNKDRASVPVYSTSWEREGPFDRWGLPSALSSTQLLVCSGASVSAHIQIIRWRRLASGACISSPKPDLSSFNLPVGIVLLYASVFFVKTNKKEFPPVHISLIVCLSVCMYVRTFDRLYIPSGCIITFGGVSVSKQNMVGVFYV